MSTCCEWVVYRLKAGQGEAFQKAHKALYEAHHRLEGFLGFETMEGLQDPMLRLDKVVWRDALCARAGFEAFQTLPEAKPFMEHVATVEYSGHFQPNSHHLD